MYFFFAAQKCKSHARRSETVLPSHVGKVFEVHNGKTNVLLTVSFFMIGHKFGEFSLTRQFYTYPH